MTLKGVPVDPATGLLPSVVRVAPENLADDDFGDFSVASGVVALENVPDLVLTSAEMSAGRKQFDPRLSFYNWKPSNTSKLRKALAAANAGDHTTIAFVGDSITAATSFTGWDLEASRDAFSYRLANALEAAGTPIAGDGPVFANNAGATADFCDARWVFGVPANWTTHTDLHAVNTTTNGATGTFTSTRPGTVVDIYYWDTGGPWTYSIDGATPVTVTPSTTNVTLKVTVSGLADTNHKVLITTTSTAVTWILAVAVRRTSGLSVINAGIGGSTTFKWRPSATGTLPLPTVLTLGQTATFVMLEANDVDAQLSLATYTAQLTATVNALQALGDVILMISPPADPGGAGFGFNKAAYDAINYALADAEDLPVIDWEHHFVDWTTFDTTLAFALDEVHPTRQAHADMGETLTQLLAGGATKQPAVVRALVGTPLGDNYATGCCNMDRPSGMAANIATGTGLLELTYFEVPAEFVAANIAFYTGSTAAGATPTLVEFSLFAVASNGDLRRIAVTGSATTFGTINTRFSKALLTAVRLVPRAVYATGVLIVTAAAAPTLLGPTQAAVAQTAASQAPRMHGVITGQASTAATYAAASVSNAALRYLAEITP